MTIYKTGIDEYENIHEDLLGVFYETIKLNPEILFLMHLLRPYEPQII